ncbi:uncharacterized protein EI90DRAFT_3135848 [Cantharellus anzutake]|uniref:uncharacterized protein n=1 Tax=Cantharellus anzutake TaxID=1750568 RepID=UPI00190673E4|nr:uncharacterized protein EI90DRAFT_3135848 [Cantharellus anzutake]KAF8314585.1 hypothetical protein EI90DRAFT_3135848 [Cantharellus anzutake]
MSATHSSPQKKSYPSSETTATGPEEVFQRDLKKRVEEELAGHAWEFDADDVARMLSPKILKQEHKDKDLLELDFFDVLVDHSHVVSVMQKVFETVPYPDPFRKRETENYGNISCFLTKCVERCRDAYESIFAMYGATGDRQAFKLQPFGKAFWPGLLFVKYDRQTGDKVKNAAPLKPDIVGLAVEDTPPSDFVACWSKPPEQSKRNPRRIAVAVEVKADWKDMLFQSCTYGRAQFNDTPLRTFTVTIAINHAAETLRVLIFHRGGLTTSKELRLTTKDGNPHDIRKFMKILLSILLWQTPGDAGFPEFTDANRFIFPSGEDDTVEAIQEQVLHNRQSSRGRNTFVALMQHFPSDNNAIPQTPLASGTGKPSTGQAPMHAFTDARSKKLKLGKTSSNDGKDKDNDEYDIIFPSPYNFNGRFDIQFRDHQATRKERMYEKVSNPSSVVKCSWPPHAKKDLECNMYRASKGEFGTMTLLSSHEPFNSRGYKSTNSYLLPGPNSNASDFHLKDISPLCPESPDYRSLAVTLLRDQGCSLEYCDTAWDLCICLLHAMLGWLSTYQCGYLQRDVSIGNVLKLMRPAQMVPFSIDKLKEFHYAIMHSNENVDEFSKVVRGKVEALEERLSKPRAAREVKDEVGKAMSTAEALQMEITELGLPAECRAIISDGDLASYIPAYLARRDTAESISGTYEFMSPGIRGAMDAEDRYLHTPLDDMYSFFYVAVWATLWNIKKGHTKREDVWRDGLRSKERDAKVADLLAQRTEKPSQTYAPIILGMIPVLDDWWMKLSQLRRSSGPSRDEDQGILRLVYFDQLAYRGIADFVQIVKKHLQQIQSTG